MRRRNFYLLCILKALGPFGSPPPVSKQEFLALVKDCDGPKDIVEALLLSEDLLQREAVLADEIEPDQADMAILSVTQKQDVQPLPDFLISEPDDTPENLKTLIDVDAMWQRYFHYAKKVSRDAGSPFLSAWVGFEVGLRNAMAIARAEALELDSTSYLVAPELANQVVPFDGIIADWASASNPLEALETLDRARWHHFIENERWFSFSDDEVAAYTAKLMLLHRWHRILDSDRRLGEPEAQL